MADLKTRKAVKGTVKTIDRAAVAAEHAMNILLHAHLFTRKGTGRSFLHSAAFYPRHNAGSEFAPRTVRSPFGFIVFLVLCHFYLV